MAISVLFDGSLHCQSRILQLMCPGHTDLEKSSLTQRGMVGCSPSTGEEGITIKINSYSSQEGDLFKRMKAALLQMVGFGNPLLMPELQVLHKFKGHHGKSICCLFLNVSFPCSPWPWVEFIQQLPLALPGTFSPALLLCGVSCTGRDSGLVAMAEN